MRFRDLVALLLGLVVVAGIGVWAFDWLSDTPQQASEPPPDTADRVAGEYLDAWEHGEHLDMAELVRDPPEDFVARHTQLRTALDPTSLRLDAGDMASDVDGRASFPVTVAMDTDYASEPITWDTELTLIRDRGQWGVEWALSTIHPELRDGWEFARSSESVGRQDILANDGTVLSGGSEVVTFGFEPTAVDDPDEVIEAFADAIPGSEDAAARELGRSDLTDGWFYPVVTVSEQQADDAAPRLREAAGVLRQTSAGRLLYDDGFAQHTVGIVAEATAEQLEQLDGAEPGIEIGQYGLERVLEERLLSSDIVRVGLRERGQPDAPLRVVIAEAQRDLAGPVTTTLDIQVQQAIENALLGVDDTVGMVAVASQDGAILGVASRPLSGYNRALEGRYPPASTFKIVTTEALIRAGMTPEDQTDCPAEATIGGLLVSNAGGSGHGSLSLREAFARSCNTTFARLGADLDEGELAAAAERFGFGIEPELPLNAFGGAFPLPEDTAESGAASFGQGRVQASALHMAGVGAAATTGRWFPPYLLAEDGPGEPQELTDDADEALRSMLRAVIVDGTGTAAAVPDHEVLGKTGTAQVQGGAEHAWFVGAYDGVGFAIIVEEGGSGGEVAAPIAGRFVRELSTLRGAAAAADDPTDAG